MRLHGGEEPRLGRQRPFIHSFIQHIFIEHLLCVRHCLLQALGVKETDNKPRHKTYAYWIVISDLKTKKLGRCSRDWERGAREGHSRKSG